MTPKSTHPDVRGFDRANHCRQIGLKGGLATKAKYAPNGQTGYYSAIGALGLKALAEGKFGGDVGAAVRWLKLSTMPTPQPIGTEYQRVVAQTKAQIERTGECPF